MEEFWFVNGKALVHSEHDCVGRYCVIHNPSDHRMRGWAMNLRETGLVERLCPTHGTGHPDPDSAEYLNLHGHIGSRGTWDIHGCCGCCVDLDAVDPAPITWTVVVTNETRDVTSVTACTQEEAWDMADRAVDDEFGPAWSIVDVFDSDTEPF